MSGQRYIRGQSKEAFKFSIRGKGKLKALEDAPGSYVKAKLDKPAA